MLNCSWKQKKLEQNEHLVASKRFHNNLGLFFPTLVKDPGALSQGEQELKDLKEQFCEDFPVGPLIGKCFTMDQV